MDDLRLPTPVLDDILAESTGYVRARLSISRPSGNMTPYINIEIDDETSGIRVLDLRVPYAQFTEALTNLSHRPCAMKLGHPEHVGKIHEVKEEIVEYIGDHPFNRESAEYKAWERKVLKAYEVDGWTARSGDVVNHHRIVQHGHGKKPTKVNVCFSRLVSPNKTKV